MPRSRLAIDISSDLVFSDPDLEEKYRKHHTEAQRSLDIQFHYARSLAWVAVGLRMLKDSSAFQHYMASFVVLFGAFTTLIPAFAHSWESNKAFVTYRPAIVLADNILQVILGCFTHQHIYPEAATSWRTAAPLRAVGVLVTGSGVAWLNMSGLLGSLIFRFAIGQQAALAILMLLASPEMCHRSFSLQKGHMAMHTITRRWAGRLLPRNIYSAISLFNPPTGAPSSPQDAAYALNVCLAYQPLIILTLGFFAPTVYLFWREMKTRKQFAVSFGKSVPTVTEVVLNPPPSMLQYFAFATPAVAALAYYVVIKGV